MLYKCNLLALVGGGPRPAFPSNKVVVWDDHSTKVVLELTFKSPVLSVKLRKDM